MKWKIFCISLLLPCFVLSASAHPGRTDSRGGHTNHSTGEYHYHHGYSEHDHYDMDGDGDPDCPYTFKDKTNSSSNAKNKKETTATSSQKAKEEEGSELGLALGAFTLWCGGSFLWDSLKKNK